MHPVQQGTDSSPAQVAELVDALVSNTNAFGRAGSTPALGTKSMKKGLYDTVKPFFVLKLFGRCTPSECTKRNVFFFQGSKITFCSEEFIKSKPNSVQLYSFKKSNVKKETEFY